MKGLNPGRVLGGGICAGVLLALGETFLNHTKMAKESATLSMGQCVRTGHWGGGNERQKSPHSRRVPQTKTSPKKLKQPQ